jgi:cation diffusion facilitator family transporter
MASPGRPDGRQLFPARNRPMPRSENFVIYAALVSNLAIAVTKFGAAVLTGSSSMVTEGVHSLVDTGNQGLLLYGVARSKRPADEFHPYGYGRELYFWSFIVAVLIFMGGAGVSIYEGFLHIQQPESIVRPWVNFVVLALAFAIESISWWAAFSRFRVTRGTMSWWQSILRSKDPSTFIILMEDSAALFGIVVATCAIALSVALDDPRIDGAGSIVIGCVLAMVAVLLARESKGLLIGEPADPALNAAIFEIARTEPGVFLVNKIVTVHLAPEQVLATASLDFEDDLRTAQIENAVVNIERRTRAAHAQVASLFVRPQARDAPEKID